MSDTIIKVENIGKKYIIGHQVQRVGDTTLRDVLMQNTRNIWNKTKDLVSGKPIIQGDTMEEVWALKDVSFEIQRGEAVGIIGRNGAGKSTLLKILSRITEPSTGRVTIKGRVASLLEVGTGFHPELTGRENIYLNGTILGMTRAEIKRKFDEIAAFAEVEKYLDTPVKRYSSGMYVRLAFAVAAHLEPEILVVDEVLAVGDAQFQKKCLGKMGDISKEGRTILFVSHNMLAVKTLCASGILLNNGTVQTQGEMSKVIEAYTATNKLSSFSIIEQESNGFIVHSISASTNGMDGNFDIEDDLYITIEVSSSQVQETININLFFNTPDGTLIFATCSSAEKFEKGKTKFQCVIPAKTFNDNMYLIDLMAVAHGPIIIHNIKCVLTLQGHEDKRSIGWLGKFPGLIRPQYFKWNKINVHA
jgi:lipopolysaccharide transport system ATP-binding protein